VDRNVVTATILIAGIMIVWLFVLSPQPTEVPSQTYPPADSELVAPQSPVTSPEESSDLEAENEISLLAVTDSTIAGASEGTERFITVETDLYEATFSTKGATIVSFILKEYKKFDQVTPVQMVDSTNGGAIALAFTTPANHFVDTRSFYFTSDHSTDRLVARDAPAELSFEVAVGMGTIRQTYTFTPGNYEVGLSIDKTNASTFVTREGYELIWEGGIPFSEGDVRTEAQAAGAFASSGGEVEEINLNSDEFEEQRLSGNVTWASIKSRYFTSVVIPSQATRGAELIGEKSGDEDTDDLWEDYTVRMLMPPATVDRADEFRFYIGPMEFYRLTGYNIGLYDMVNYGWFGWLTRPLAKFIFIPVFTFLASFIPSYGLVIIVFSILIKIVVYPLTQKSFKSMARMKELQPKMEAIKEKHGDNPQKQQEAMMKMYKETGVNPLGGCLPMLLQYPIIIALWLFLPQAIEIRQQGFLWAADLSAPDVILNLPFNIPLYGDFVGGFTLLMGISMIVQMKIQTTSAVQNAQTKIFTYVFPVMIFAIFNRLASGLSLYYLCYNVFTAIQQKYINTHLKTEKEEDKQGKKGSKKTDARAKKSTRQLPGGKGSGKKSRGRR